MSNPTTTAPIPDKSAVVASPSSTCSMGNKDAGATKQALLRCPRCDSTNTKFCYYNNYSLSQPRHFCKTCRRYWTQGGALRNVPVGGGCRKNKKLKSSSSSSSTAIDHFGLTSGHLYGPFGTNPNPNPNPNPNHRFAVEPSVLTMGFMGPNQLDMSGHVTNFVHQSSSLASSIESLSCINQDMHWKLQQQRLSVFFAGDIQNKQATRVSIPTHQLQDPNPIDHQLFSSSANSASNKGREEWFFVNSGTSINPNLTDGGGGGGGGFGDQGNPNWSNGVQATWTTTLP